MIILILSWILFGNMMIECCLLLAWMGLLISGGRDWGKIGNVGNGHKLHDIVVWLRKGFLSRCWLLV